MSTAQDICIPEFLIATTDVSEVYGTPHDKVFTARSKLFNKDVTTHAYVDQMSYKPDTGRVEFVVKWKQIGQYEPKSRKVRWPFHMLRNGGLFAFKRNKQRTDDGFGLNHELFTLDWDTSIILHFVGDTPYLFIASRDVWLNKGIATERNEELQVFLNVPDYEKLPTTRLPEMASDWLKACMDMESKKA